MWKGAHCLPLTFGSIVSEKGEKILVDIIPSLGNPEAVEDHHCFNNKALLQISFFKESLFVVL